MNNRKKPIAIISDIDECSDLSLNDCPPSTSFCRNAYGNYSCECLAGFQMRNGACEGRVNYICYLGGFFRHIWSLFYLNGSLCLRKVYPRMYFQFYNFFLLDINECELSVHGCSHMCINTDGDYNCACYYGFTLGNNRKSCEKGYSFILLVTSLMVLFKFFSNNYWYEIANINEKYRNQNS